MANKARSIAFIDQTVCQHRGQSDQTPGGNKKTIVQSSQMKLLNDLLIISRVVSIGGVLGKEKIHQGADTIDPQRQPGLPNRIKSSVRLNNQG